MLRFSQIQIMKAMTKGTTLIMKGAAEFHKQLPRCKDLPALVGVADNADALLLLLTLMLLELVEPVVVVPVGGTTVGVSTAAELVSVELGVVTELELERDVVGSVAPLMESEAKDDDEMADTGKATGVIAKMELVSPESPNTRNPNTHISRFVFSSFGGT